MAGLPRGARIGLFVVAGFVALVALVLGLAFAFMPREWIDQEAKRQAAQVPGAAVSWKTLEPGFDGLSIGIRISGLAVTAPKTGDPRLDLRAQEVFVRFKILPLLFRRVEIAAAKVKNAGIATWDRGPLPPEAAAAGGAAAPAMALVLPKLELDGIDVRTRDLYGGGIDLRRLHGTAEIGGTLDRPTSVRVAASIDSLFWKGSARDPLLPLPSPLRADLAMKGSQAGSGSRLDVARGVVTLGPLKSQITGSIELPPAPAPARLDLAIAGAKQEIRSSDPAFRAFAAASPASWSTQAAWNVKIGGTAAAMVQSGEVTLAPVSVESGSNRFALDRVRGAWDVTPDQRFTAKADGEGSGLTLRLDMRGSTVPGGESNGTLQVDVPATRLNGLAPNTPTWTKGQLGMRAVFVNRAPAPPDVRWTLQGRDLSGTSPGLQPPIKHLQFAVAGTMERVDVNSLDATVGSSTAHAKGAVVMGKPLGTGEFTAQVDRFVAEEWAPPKGAAAKGPATPAASAPPPPIPFKRLSANVSIGEVRQGTMTLRDVTVPLLYENGTLTVDPIRGSLGTGTVAGALTVKNLATSPSYQVKLDVAKAPVDELARGMIPFRLGVSGLLSGNVDLSGPGLPGPEVSESLRGSLAGTIEQGKIDETPGLKAIQGALGLSNSNGIPFKTLSHVLRIEGGRLLLDKVKGDLGADKFEMTGALGLDKSLNLGLLVRLAPERVKGNTALAQFARYAKDADGRLPVELGIGGTTDAPKVQLKTGKLLDVAGQGLKEELTKSLTQTLTKSTAPPPGATDSTHARGDSTATARPESTATEDPLKKGKEALRRLLGK